MDPEQPYAVILSPLALQDLTEIAADNPPAAERFGRALIQKTRLLELISKPILG